jgi:DNA-binding NarL/FixJ family response regulator
VARDQQQPIRIVVADDSVVIREGLATILHDEPEVELVAVCGDGEQLERLVGAGGVDVVVADIRMPPSGDREGIRVANRLRKTAPEVGVVVLSQHLQPDYAVELMGAGTKGRAYLLKDRLSDAATLMRAIASVAEGDSFIDALVVEALIAGRAQESSPLDRLTQRELEILAQIAEGKSNAAIADSLVLTKRAVEKHVNSIFAKLDFADPGSVSRRVKATLLFLSERERGATATG